MPAPPRRLWCACVVIDYLKGTERAQPCNEIIEHAERGETEIVVSILAHAEVAMVYRDGTDEARIAEFFSRAYIVSAQLTRAVAEEARRLVREGLMKKPLDAVHAATATLYHIPVIETFNVKDFIQVQGAGTPPVGVREPLWDPIQPNLPMG
jgi:predicted nucleic acid-binding protein